MTVVQLLDTRLAPFRRTATTTGGLVATTLLTSATGFVFWWLAVQYFPAAAVGLAAAAISAMILLSQVAELGLGTKLAGVLHREEPRALVPTALLATGTAGALLGLGFALLGPAAFDELQPVAARPLALIVFVAGVSLSAVGSVLDQVLVAMSRTRDRITRNALFAFGRLALLPVAALAFPGDGGAIYAAWVGGVIVSLIALIAIRKGTLKHLRPRRWPRIRGMAGDTAAHHVVNLSRSSSLWLLPLIVTVILSTEVNASFYIALLLVNFVALVGSSATFTLYVVTAAAPHVLLQQLRFTLALSGAAVGIGAVGFWFAGRPLLAMFNETYADTAYPTIVVLAATCIPMLVKDHWIALQRIRGAMRWAAWISIGGLVLELSAAAIGALYGGIEGLAIARLGAVLLQVIFMAPLVLRAAIDPTTYAAESNPEPVMLERVGIGR